MIMNIFKGSYMNIKKYLWSNKVMVKKAKCIKFENSKAFKTLIAFVYIKCI